MLLPTAYLPPISWLKQALSGEAVVIEAKEHFSKQTWRNRCRIYGGNGPIELVIPVDHTNRWRIPIDELKTSSATDWKSLHWKSIRSAYGKAPYFEYYAETIEACFRKDAPEHLLDFNEACLRSVLKLLKADIPIERTESFTPYTDNDPRLVWSEIDAETGWTFPSYYQSFADRHGFLPNLSSLDLLFHLGPDSREYLEKITRA